MKEKAKKQTSKQIICIIITIMLCNFIMPNYTYAIETNGGGSMFDPIMKFVTFLCDSLMQFMQNTFTSNASIEQEGANGKYYNFQYSPAIIFSGTVMGLDINFITPNTDVRTVNNFEAFLRIKADEYAKAKKWNWVGYNSSNLYNNEVKDLRGYIKVKMDSSAAYDTDGYHKCEIYYLEENNILYTKYIYFGHTDNSETLLTYTPEPWPIDQEEIEETTVAASYTSIANDLQPTIATWYNALRRIALVGLLSVLVYLGIRVVLSSSSPEGNSKYKKMLTDWLIALCLLFTLHYIMSATLVITKKLSAIFNPGDTDLLLNTLRGEIADNEICSTWGEALGRVIMYVVLVIYTVTFTFKYLKRVLYMAFFTMIAPLITLTYPIDKVSDGQAQAFNMWIREYIFNALIQVVHLIVYYTLVGSALDLVTSFPLYAVIAIGFMTQGEAIIRKMFGFNNAETIGAVGAAATGGLISSAMNKLKSLPSAIKGGDKGSSGSSGGNSNNKVRTATKNPKAGEKGNGGGNTTDSKVSSGNSQKTSEESTKKQRDIKGSGAMAVVGKYYRPVAGTALGVLTGGAGAIIGFSAGVAQGDLGAAFGGAVAGGAAGMNLGKGAVNLPGNVKDKVKTGWNNAKDTYREGTYGEEENDAEKIRDN